MKHFEHINAKSFEEASRLVREGKGAVNPMAGGSDLLGVYKDRLLPSYPETVVNLKSIPGFNRLEDTEDTLVVGAGCTLTDVAENDAVKAGCPALAEAAHSVASPLIRNIGTIGGNVCQDVRCWYYRYPDSMGGRLNCRRKGGDTCYAINGENCYHSVFGGMKVHGCSSCSKGCPAGTDIPGYMACLRSGDWDGAAKTIMQYNPMPAVTSRICPHTCQDKCSQTTYGEAVNIHAVERSLGDYIMERSAQYYAPPAAETGKKVIVVGAGPGGLAAAYYLRRAGHTVDVYDRMEKPGGVLRYGIPHYRLPKSIVDGYADALEAMGVTFHMGVNVGADVTVEELRAKCDSIYFGTGAWKQPVLGLQGEELTEFGLNFLVEVNTYLEKTIGNDVLVCGGGNVAMDVALTAKRLGAKSVKLVCLEQRDEMPASAEEVAMAEEEGVEITNGWGLGKVLTDGGKVSGLEAKRCLSVRDENGRFAPAYDEADRMVIASDYIILATGQRVDVEFLGEKLGSQLKSGRGLIDADLETLKTKMEGVYAGGDAVTGPDLAIRAIRAGRVAASNMNRDLGGETGTAGQRGQFVSFDRAGIEATACARLPERPACERTLIDEDRSSLDESAVLAEAARCMNCGCYAVNPSDVTPVLVMLDAKVVTTERTLTARELFTSQLKAQDVLNPGELVREIRVPKKPGVSHYDKRRVRDAIDFATVSLASRFEVEDGVIVSADIVFGGVAPVPYETPCIAAHLKGKAITPELAAEAAEMAVKNAVPMAKNEYKLFMIKDLISSAILRAK